MSLSNLVRVGGFAAVLAGTLLILDNWTLLLELLGAFPENFSEEALTISFTAQSVAYLIGVLLLLVALVGFHIRQSEAAGTLGIVGFIAALTGTGLLVSMMGTITFDASTLVVEAPALLDQEEEPPGALGFGFLLSGICAGVGWRSSGGPRFEHRSCRALQP